MEVVVAVSCGDAMSRLRLVLSLADKMSVRWLPEKLSTRS